MDAAARHQWQAATNDWLMWINSGAVSRHTVQLRRYQLTRAAGAMPCGPWEITPEHLQAWLSRQEWSPETRRSYLAALRSFFGWAHAHGLMVTDPSRLLRKVKSTKGRPRPATERTVDRALGRADTRQHLMIMLASRHGLRRGEICQVNTGDVVEDLDGWSLEVHGKGDKTRVVPLNDDVARVLRAMPAGWVFPNGLGGHLSAAHTGKLMVRAMQHEATAHQLRHRFATRAYQGSLDILNVQRLLGHENVATTQIYARPAESEMRNVMRWAA